MGCAGTSCPLCCSACPLGIHLPLKTSPHHPLPSGHAVTTLCVCVYVFSVKLCETHPIAFKRFYPDPQLSLNVHEPPRLCLSEDFPDTLWSPSWLKERSSWLLQGSHPFLSWIFHFSLSYLPLQWEPLWSLEIHPLHHPFPSTKLYPTPYDLSFLLNEMPLFSNSIFPCPFSSTKPKVLIPHLFWLQDQHIFCLFVSIWFFFFKRTPFLLSFPADSVLRDSVHLLEFPLGSCWGFVGFLCFNLNPGAAKFPCDMVIHHFFLNIFIEV